MRMRRTILDIAIEPDGLHHIIALLELDQDSNGACIRGFEPWSVKCDLGRVCIECVAAGWVVADKSRIISPSPCSDSGVECVTHALVVAEIRYIDIEDMVLVGVHDEIIFMLEVHVSAIVINGEVLAGERLAGASAYDLDASAILTQFRESEAEFRVCPANVFYLDLFRVIIHRRELCTRSEFVSVFCKVPEFEVEDFGFSNAQIRIEVLTYYIVVFACSIQPLLVACDHPAVLVVCADSDEIHSV